MNEEPASTEPRHPIGVVARRTGISLHVLRAWERRYGVVRPVRTGGGQRLYSDADIVRLRLLREATEAGRSIGSVAELGTDELAALVGGDAGAPQRADAAEPVRDAAGVVREACMEAANALNGPRLRALLMRALVRLRPLDFVDRVVGPLLEEVGDAWHEGTLTPAHEHLVSVTVRHVLAWALEAFDPEPGAPAIVVTTVEGERHELGAMLAAVVAAEEGWRAVYLGPSLPARDIAHGVEATGALGAALSIVLPDADVEEEIEALREALGTGRMLLVGGRGATARRDALTARGASVLADMAALRTLLRTVHAAGAAG